MGPNNMDIMKKRYKWGEVEVTRRKKKKSFYIKITINAGIKVLEEKNEFFYLRFNSISNYKEQIIVEFDRECRKKRTGEVKLEDYKLECNTENYKLTITVKPKFYIPAKVLRKRQNMKGYSDLSFAPGR